MGNPQRGARRRALVAAILSSLVAAGAPAGRPAMAARPKLAAPQLAAQRSLQQGIAAMISRDFATAGQALAASLRQWPRPEVLYYLGALAQAEGRTLDAQDLMRRYLSDPQQDAAADSPEQKEAERILSLPRPPHGKLQVVGEAGTLVAVDGRLLGSLPLSQPLLLSPGEHKVSLQVGAQQQEEAVTIQLARFVELRYSSATRSVVLSVVPVMLLLDDDPGPGGEAPKQLARAIDSALQAEHFSPLRRAAALESVRDSSLAGCLDTLPCQAQLARHNGADFALRVRVRGSEAGRQLTLELVHAAVAEVAAHTETSCPGACELQDATAALQRVLPGLIAEARKRPAGLLVVESKPTGAEVYCGEQRLGLTPLELVRWAGPLELELRLPGSLSERRKVTVPDADKVALSVELRPEVRVSAAAPVLRLLRPPRPRWRYIAGAAVAAAGVILVGVGGAALAANGTCVGTPAAPGGQCLEVHATGTVGGALLGVGLGVLGAGALFIAIPPPPRLEKAAP